MNWVWGAVFLAASLAWVVGLIDPNVPKWAALYVAAAGFTVRGAWG